MEKAIKVIVRILSMSILLYFVWQGNEKATAVSFFLLFIRAEILGYAFQKYGTFVDKSKDYDIERL